LQMNPKLEDNPSSGSDNPCSRARAAMEDVFRLEHALGFIHDEYIHELSIALMQLLDSEKALVSDLEEILGGDAYEVVLLGFTWRLILPRAPAGGSMAWEDAQPPLDGQSGLKLPLVIEKLVRSAAKSGHWSPRGVLPETSPLLPDSPEIITWLLQFVQEYAQGQVIGANELRAAFSEAGAKCDLDALIAHWKGAGVLSPRLSSLKSVADHRSPVYELNPAVF